MVKKLFGPLRERYANRPGGYTRLLLIEPLKEDQAPSAILELVDGPKDMRFAMTARTISKCEKDGKELNEMTQRNIEKVTQFRKDGKQALDQMVKRMKTLPAHDRTETIKKAWVYPTHEKEKEEARKLMKQKPTTFLV
jgi:large subunit ribosomal protein L17